MKYFALFTLVALPLTLLGQEVKKVQEPEYVGIVFYLDSTGALSPLEKQQPDIQFKTKAMGLGGAKSSTVFQGAKSPVRFKAGQDLQFVVRLYVSGIDPSSLVKLEILKPSKNQREIVDIKVNFMGTSAKSSNGTSRPLSIVKYGEQSFKVSPAVPLDPGEYAITAIGGLQQSFLFGIDPK